MTRIIDFADRLLLMVRHVWHRNCFVFLEKSRCKFLDLGQGNHFNVPVRGDGKGTLMIGSHNDFGFRLAPIMGSGQILLQARRPESELIIGNSNMFSNNVSIIATKKINIGNFCRIGDQVIIMDSDFHVITPSLRETNAGSSEPVYIGNNVWLGSRVMVLKGVTIGDNSVVGAMSIVNKSIPANCVASGTPARIKRVIE